MSKQYIGCIYVCMLKKTIVHVYVLITVYTIQLYAFEKIYSLYFKIQLYYICTCMHFSSERKIFQTRV